MCTCTNSAVSTLTNFFELSKSIRAYHFSERWYRAFASSSSSLLTSESLVSISCLFSSFSTRRSCCCSCSNWFFHSSLTWRISKLQNLKFYLPTDSSSKVALSSSISFIFFFKSMLSASKPMEWMRMCLEYYLLLLTSSKSLLAFTSSSSSFLICCNTCSRIALLKFRIEKNMWTYFPFLLLIAFLFRSTFLRDFFSIISSLRSFWILHLNDLFPFS